MCINTLTAGRRAWAEGPESGERRHGLGGRRESRERVSEVAGGSRRHRHQHSGLRLDRVSAHCAAAAAASQAAAFAALDVESPYCDTYMEEEAKDLRTVPSRWHLDPLGQKIRYHH